MSIEINDLDELIAKAKEVREKHGNLPLYHNDTEWGLGDAVLLVVTDKENDWSPNDCPRLEVRRG